MSRSMDHVVGRKRSWYAGARGPSLFSAGLWWGSLAGCIIWFVSRAFVLRDDAWTWSSDARREITGWPPARVTPPVLEGTLRINARALAGSVCTCGGDGSGTCSWCVAGRRRQARDEVLARRRQRKSGVIDHGPDEDGDHVTEPAQPAAKARQSERRAGQKARRGW